MGYAGRHRVFTYASWVLSAISALTALVPFLYIWKILRDVLNAAPNYAQAVNIPHYGWMAVPERVDAFRCFLFPAAIRPPVPGIRSCNPAKRRSCRSWP